MSIPIRSVIVGAGLVAGLSAMASAQTTTTSETKKFEVIAVDGNQLVVTLPEGTREIAVPPGFMFTVNGKQLSVQQLKPGMAGTATITRSTTVTPVTATEVKNGTVVQASGASIIVRTDDGFKMFTQGDVDKRGVKIMRGGKPAAVSDFRTGDQLSAIIITSLPPRVVTEQEVNATLTASGAPPLSATPNRGGAGAPGAAGSAPGGRERRRAPRRRHQRPPERLRARRPLRRRHRQERIPHPWVLLRARPAVRWPSIGWWAAS